MENQDIYIAIALGTGLASFYGIGFYPEIAAKAKRRTELFLHVFGAGIVIHLLTFSFFEYYSHAVLHAGLCTAQAGLVGVVCQAWKQKHSG